MMSLFANCTPCNGLFVCLQRAHKENMKINEQLEKERKRKEDSRTLKKPKQTRSRAPVVDITGGKIYRK